jgi:hypothetical protein
MKGETEIRGRLNQLLSEELNRRIASATEKLPCRCVHNYRHPLDQRKKVDGESNETYNRITDNRGLPVLQTIGLCMLGSKDPEMWGGTICEEPLDAIRCPVFEPARKKADLLKEFREQLRDESWTRGNLPEVFSLLWLLEEAEAKDQPQIVETQEKIERLIQQEEAPKPPAPKPEPDPITPPADPYDSTGTAAPPVPWWKAWLLRLLGAEPKRLS